MTGNSYGCNIITNIIYCWLVEELEAVSLSLGMQPFCIVRNLAQFETGQKLTLSWSETILKAAEITILRPFLTVMKQREEVKAEQQIIRS